MGDSNIRLSDGDRSLTLPGARVINVSTSAKTEKQRGASTIRFLLEGDVVMGADPFDTLSLWEDEDKSFALEVADWKVQECFIRECSLDPSTQRLYVTIYTSYPAQEVRHWFEV